MINIIDVIDKKKCTGCSACINNCPKQCIKLLRNNDGFLYPVINQLDCINCGQCDKTCPILNYPDLKKIETTAFAAHSLDDAIRCESSSGGIFSMIAKSILEKDGFIYGAAFNKDFQVQHICIDKESDLWKLRGAKYAQSNISSCFKQIKNHLDTGNYILFSGTPCQIAGLKSFLHIEYEKLFTVDFVCHGVPSPLVWEKYVQYRSDEDNAGVLPEKINLRDKKTGWSRYQYSNVYNYQEGNTYSVLNSDDLFMKLFVGDYINRTSCSDCHFKGYSRVSDITLGDFWGIWDILPDMDDNKGTSLVLVHSESGRQMMHKISDKIKAKEVTLQQASEQNPSLLISSAGKSNRNLILQKCINGQFDEVQQILSEQQNQSNQKKYIKVLRKLYHKLRNE